MKTKKHFEQIIFPSLVILVTVILFIVPLFWLKPGYVDLGGDAGRLYFIDPLYSAHNLIRTENIESLMNQALVAYEYFLYLVKLILGSSTALINFSNGLNVSFAFLFSYLAVRELLLLTERRLKGYIYIAALTGAVLYVSFISNTGWAQALYTQNQIFLNPLIFYLLLRFCLTSSVFYGLAILGVTVLFSGNFGFAAVPQLMSFYPLAILFLVIFSRFITHVAVPWKKLLFIALVFIGLHAFHILPLIASIFRKTDLSNFILNNNPVASSGVQYFDANHIELGKIGRQLFAPSNWGSQSLLAVAIPVLAIFGFLLKRSKLLLVTGIFFAVTLFLDSANITKFGVWLYRSLFYIPVFSMFRSFNDKFYYVFSFFYMLLFSFSFYALIKRWKVGLAILSSVIIIGIVTYRIFPFLQGKALYEPLYQTIKVTPVLKLDPDLMDALEFTKNLPQDGKVLTVPLTFPYYQIAYGIEGGAYRGISMVSFLSGHDDYSGFWSFGQYQKPVFDALQQKNTDAFLSILKRLEVRYIFRNSDPRIMDNFPGYPYVYPGMTYSSKDQLPIIKDQKAYDALIASLPVKKIYEKGFYSVYEFTGMPDFPQSAIDPVLHPYFVAGRIASAATAILILGYVCRLVVHKRYEKQK